MPREFFNRQFAAMCAAYTISMKLGEESQDVYWSMLQDIPEARFARAVEQCLASCKFFPAISELGEAAFSTEFERAPYSPYGSLKPRKITWREQVRELKAEQIAALPDGLKDIVRKIGG